MATPSSTPPPTPTPTPTPPPARGPAPVPPTSESVPVTDPAAGTASASATVEAVGAAGFAREVWNVLVDWFSSLRLTVVLLTLSMVLVFVGTLAQVQVGIFAAQERYFRSLVVMWQIPNTGLSIPVLPGGYLIGTLLLINLIAAPARRWTFTRDKVGLILIHAGMVLLLLGQLFTDLWQVESSMRLVEGEAKNYSQSSRHSELALTEVSQPGQDRVVAIPESRLAAGAELTHPDLPFTVRVKDYWVNSRQVAPDVQGPPLATQGLGREARLGPVPATARMDERNVPAAIVEVIAPSGSLGTWLVSDWLNGTQTFTAGERTFQIALRLARYYKPFSVELLAFSHDKYRGTEIPKNFSSRVRVRHAGTGEDREVLIYMNNPLRYGGETFYQSGYDPNDRRVTILQVVRNPGWLTPYVSCGVVTLGLVLQFLMHLTAWAKNKNA